MNVREFDMVRMQYAYECKVDYNLSGSGVPSLNLHEIIDGACINKILSEAVQDYPPAGGSLELRSVIAAMYPNASADNVFVTNGATEANFMAAWRLFEKGDEVVVMVPGYLQTYHLSHSWGLDVRLLPLREDQGWQFDVEDLKSLVNSKTKAIQVCNPNNPTGAVMAQAQRTALMDIAKDAGAWILSDEVYIGAERGGPRTESLWDKYERTLITNGLCKAYGLPGLRIGWLVGAQQIIREMASYHDFLTLTHSMPCDLVARLVIEPEVRERVLARNQSVICEGHHNLKDWMTPRDSSFSYLPPAAGPMCFIRPEEEIDSIRIAERLLKEKSVLVVPGSHMGLDGYLRIGTSVPRESLHAGLDRIDNVLRSRG